MVRRVSFFLAAVLIGSSVAEAGPAPRLGFTSMPLPKKKAEMLGIDSGAKVTSTIPGCPGNDFLSRGDVVYEISGDPVRTLGDMHQVYAKHVATGSVTVKLVRGTEKLEAEMPLFGCAEHRKAEEKGIPMGAAGEGEGSGGGGGGVGGLKYASPILSDGTLAAWGSPDIAKQLVGDLASKAGGQAASMAVNQAASKIPFAGGLVSAAAKKATEAAIDAAVTGKLEADQRFATACELGQHLQSHASRPDFAQVMLAVNTVYVDEVAAIAACMAPGSVPSVPVPPPVVEGPPPKAPAVPAAIPAAVAPAGDGLTEQLKALTELHKAGALTDKEFAAAKARLLGL